ncbi:MAG: 2Fe-2S iron-sulfur cluster binding domain-containing protein [Arenicellales bacterium WSBS_2016_MAG_OTU3]
MKITVTKKSSSHEFLVQPNERILYAGLKHGLTLPYECATGTCGTCKAKLISGDLKPLWPEAPGATKCKEAKGEFLMCQCAALTDCEISFRGKLEHQKTKTKPSTYAGTISEVTSLTHDVLRFVIRLETPVCFQAGQFVVVNTADVTGGRAYSMVNAQGLNNELELIIKRFPDGGFSEWMFADSRVDSSVEVYGALGKAVLNDGENKDIVCIAGGSGIAGLMSILQQTVSDGFYKRNRANVFFGVRTSEDVFFAQRLAGFVEQARGKLTVNIVLSEGEVTQSLKTDWPHLQFATGFVTPVAMHNMAERFKDSTIAFVAGPPPMVDDALRQLILEAGLAAENVRYDKFG